MCRGRGAVRLKGRGASVRGAPQRGPSTWGRGGLGLGPGPAHEGINSCSAQEGINSNGNNIDIQFEEVSLNSSHPSPGASEGGLGAAGQVALRADPWDLRDWRDPRNSSAR